MLDSRFIQEYKDEVYHKLSLAGIETDLIDDEKLNTFILKDFKNKEVEIYNNMKHEKIETDLLKLTELVYYSDTKPIITAYNTLFHSQDKVTNIPSGFLDYLKSERDDSKGKMYRHINDADPALYNSFNFEQLVFKLIANSYYGAFGMKAFHFFNALLGPSVTAQGRQLISASILAFEGFLGNSIKFNDIDGISTFLSNILSEEYDEEMVLETAIEINEQVVLERIISLCDFILTEQELEYLEMVISDRPLTVLQKLYYKNDLYGLFEIEELKQAVRDHLVVDGFHDATKPPAELMDVLNELAAIIRYFVGYPYPYDNKTKHVSEMMREVVLLCDTDSTFLHVYRWLEYVCDVTGQDVNTISNDRRVSTISIISYFVTNFINEVFEIFCRNSNVPASEFHRINMKGEFHIRRIVLTKNKKSYASNILSKEGNVYDEPKFDLKGIPIKKISTPRAARIFFSNLLEEEILNSPTINIKEIYEMYHGYTKEIDNSVLDGDTTYLKVGVLKTLSAYKKPYTLQSVRSTLVWNALYGDKNYIPSFSNFKILELDQTIIPPIVIPSGQKDEDNKHILVDNDDFFPFIIDAMGEDFADKLERLYEEHPGLKQYGLGILAIPTNVDAIPTEFLKLVDVGSITNSVMKKGNILLESLGFVLVTNNNRAVVSNMLKI